MTSPGNSKLIVYLKGTFGRHFGEMISVLDLATLQNLREYIQILLDLESRSTVLLFNINDECK